MWALLTSAHHCSAQFLRCLHLLVLSCSAVVLFWPFCVDSCANNLSKISLHIWIFHTIPRDFRNEVKNRKFTQMWAAVGDQSSLGPTQPAWAGLSPTEELSLLLLWSLLLFYIIVCLLRSHSNYDTLEWDSWRQCSRRAVLSSHSLLCPLLSFSLHPELSLTEHRATVWQTLASIESQRKVTINPLKNGRLSMRRALPLRLDLITCQQFIDKFFKQFCLP